MHKTHAPGETRSRRLVRRPGAWVHWCMGALLLSMLASQATAGELIDRVVAVVGGDLILMSDVRAATTLGLVDTAGAADPMRTALTRLIDRALVLDEVSRYLPPEPDADAIDNELRLVRERFATAQAFAAAMTGLGLSDAELREIVRQNLRIRAYVDQRFAADTPERAQAAIADWVAGLRRRAEIIDTYTPRR
jgi:hypothetical protein